MGTEKIRGFTLVELMVTATILTVMVFIVSTLSVAGTEAQEYARRLSLATEINQDILDEMRMELVSSVALYGNDVDGLQHTSVFDLTDTSPPIAGTLLPSIDASGIFEKDVAGSEKTGNALFFAAHAWTDEYLCGSGESYRVDVYRWYAYYLTASGAGPTPGNATGLGLVKVVGEPLVDGSQVDKITDATDQEEVLLHLINQTPDVLGTRHARVEVVWKRGDSPAAAGTFRQIDETDGTMSATPFAGRPNPWRVLQAPRLTRGDLLSYRHHSVATNYARRSTGVGRFGIVDNTGDGFPHGFEVQVIGPSSARQVLLHLVVAGTRRDGQLPWSDFQTIVDARDM